MLRRTIPSDQMLAGEEDQERLCLTSSGGLTKDMELGVTRLEKRGSGGGLGSGRLLGSANSLPKNLSNPGLKDGHSP